MERILRDGSRMTRAPSIETSVGILPTALQWLETALEEAAGLIPRAENEDKIDDLDARPVLEEGPT